MYSPHARTIAELQDFGVKVDKSATDALALLDAAKAVTLHNPTADLTAAYDAGKLTPANIGEHIIHAATIAAAADRVGIAAETIAQAVHGTISAWLRANADRILKDLRPAFDQAAALVQVAAVHFPPDASAKQILDGGTPAVEAHEQLTDALDILTRLRSLRVAVGEAARHGEQDASWYITGAKDMPQLEAAHRAFTGSGDAFHSLAALGFVLRLNSTAEAAKVAAGARATTDQAEAEARNKRTAQVVDGWPSWSDPTTVKV